MNTDDLVAMLAAGEGPVARDVAARRWSAALLAGTFASVALLLLLLGARSDLAGDVARPMLWVKFGFVALFAAAGLTAATRLARPGLRVRPASWALVGSSLLTVWCLGLLAMAAAAPDQRVALWLGRTWQVCPVNIALLSAPLLVAALWAMRGLAPTRPVHAGAAAGLLAGGAGAFVYAFHCPELDAPFLATWYVLGVSIPVAAGALLGPRVLRW